MNKGPKPQFINFIIPVLVMVFNVFVIFYPKEIIGASKEGLQLWFNNVLPSLLPFVIGANLLTGLGFVRFLGALLEPVMYPLFGVPGTGGFSLISGMTSGYPIGAKITAELRQSEDISKDEAQRLAAFTNNSGPLFILGAVGIGMFQNSTAGYFLMLVHYCSAILNGFIWKHYNRRKMQKHKLHRHSLVRYAGQQMKLHRQKDGRNLGLILGDSVKNATETLIQVGGFIVLFCVLVEILQLTNTLSFIKALLLPLLGPTGMENIFDGLFVGIIELTNGANVLSQAGINFATIAATAFLISFGGFSIHAQSINFLSKTDINLFVYILSKTVQGILAIGLSFLLYPFFNFEASQPVMAANWYTQFSLLEKMRFTWGGLIISLLILLFCICLNGVLLVHRKKKPPKYKNNSPITINKVSREVKHKVKYLP